MDERNSCNGNATILSFTDGLIFTNGRDLTVVDSSGNIKGQNTIELTIDPPVSYSELSNGSIVSGGAFYSWERFHRVYNRSGFVFSLNEEGQGVIDSTSFYHLGDPDLDGFISYYDDAVMVAAKLGETHNVSRNIVSTTAGCLIFSADWQQSFGNGLNLKYCDVNQDEIIDTNDLNAISDYPLNLTNGYVLHTDTAGLQLFCRTSTNVYIPGDTLTYWIISGEEVDSLYGVSLYAGIAGPVAINMQEINFNYGILGDTSTNLFIHYNNPQSPYQKSYVVCRTDQQNTTIFSGDTLATVKCLIDPALSIPGSYPMIIYAHFISKDGYTIPYNLTSDSLTVLSTSIKENYDKSITRVYPNPVKDILYIKSANKIKTVKLSDVTGRIILRSKTDSNEYELNVSDLTAGVYYLECTSDSGVEIIKVLREK